MVPRALLLCCFYFLYDARDKMEGENPLCLAVEKKEYIRRNFAIKFKVSEIKLLFE